MACRMAGFAAFPADVVAQIESLGREKAPGEASGRARDAGLDRVDVAAELKRGVTLRWEILHGAVFTTTHMPL